MENEKPWLCKVHSRGFVLFCDNGVKECLVQLKIEANEAVLRLGVVIGQQHQKLPAVIKMYIRRTGHHIPVDRAKGINGCAPCAGAPLKAHILVEAEAHFKAQKRRRDRLSVPNAQKAGFGNFLPVNRSCDRLVAAGAARSPFP